MNMNGQSRMNFGKHFNWPLNKVIAMNVSYVYWFLRDARMRKKYPQHLEYFLTFVEFEEYLNEFLETGKRLKQRTPKLETRNMKTRKQKESDQNSANTLFVNQLLRNEIDFLNVELDSQQTGSGSPQTITCKAVRGIEGLGDQVLVVLNNGALALGVIVGIYIQPDISIAHAGFILSSVDTDAADRFFIRKEQMLKDVARARKAKAEADQFAETFNDLEGHAVAGSVLEQKLKAELPTSTTTVEEYMDQFRIDD